MFLIDYEVHHRDLTFSLLSIAPAMSRIATQVAVSLKLTDRAWVIWLHVLAYFTPTGAKGYFDLLPMLVINPPTRNPRGFVDPFQYPFQSKVYIHEVDQHSASNHKSNKYIHLAFTSPHFNRPVPKFNQGNLPSSKYHP